MKAKTLFTVLVTMIGFLCAASTSALAEDCTNKVNYTFTPNQPLKAVTAGWLQWLSHGNFSCSGNTAHLHCTRKSEAYDSYYVGAPNNPGNVWVFDAAGNLWDTASFFVPSNGQVWSWSWDGGIQFGRTTLNCVVTPFNPCESYFYGTCD